MIRINAFDKMICRTPAFSINQQLPNIWDELKAKIEGSSPAFYAIIKHVDASDLSQLDEKTRFTIWKYLNRAKYRSTPFGSFAAISLMTIGSDDAVNIQINKKMDLHHFTDWSQKIKHLPKNLSKINFLISNSTIYMVDQEIRYIKAKDGTFELAAVETIPELCNILMFCKRKRSINELIELMKYTFNYDSESTKALLMQMIKLQLLYTDQHPNITGTDYFKRLGVSCQPDASNYIMAERKIGKGNFNANLLQHLPNYIHQMQQLIPLTTNNNLEDFKQSFTKRYEQRKVSLAIALDPELGIGYGNLAQPSNADPLVKEIELNAGNQTPHQIEYGSLQQFLLRKIIEGKPINIDEYQIETELKNLLPNSLSVMFNVHEGNLVLASAGGSSANVLLGRFTNCSAEWESYGLEIAQLEQKANEDIEFFDIAYQAEKKVDNVNRRKQMYANELPILSWSEVDSSLNLNDILVSVVRNEVILSSKKSGKRLIPRLASAYNYTRSDLAVYRFLCDIQTQGLAINLNFNLGTFFPKLNHYPRVYYKNIIIEKASWLINLSVIQNEDSLLLWLAENKVDHQLIVGDSDQSLYFDLTKKEDIWAFLKYGKQQETDFYVREALTGENDFIKDENGLEYYPQYIVNYYHKNTIYQSKKNDQLSSEHQIYLPGSNWLYVEFYCHISFSNHLLLSLSQFIKSHKKSIDNWFFIRYSDPKPHIRLRLKTKSEKENSKLLSALRNLADPLVKNGNISDVQVKSYRPELDRYGKKRILLVEQFFSIDSIFVLWMLSKYKEEQILKILALETLKTMCNVAYPDIENQLSFAKTMAASFAKEMGLEATIFKKINSTYNELKSVMEKENHQQPLAIVKKRNELLGVLFEQCENDQIKRNLLADLIHMHVNRLFNDAQRIHETILYQFLARKLQTNFSLLKAKQAL